MQRLKLTLAYLGTPFSGWQRQQNGRTVQGELEEAASTVCGRRVVFTGAGRTDAGVHAVGQVAHCDLPEGVPPESFRRALQRRLPAEISVRGSVAAGSGFHARHTARAKLYVYRARWRSPGLPWTNLRSATLPPPRMGTSLESAVALLAGRHDFASFTVPEVCSRSTVRTVFRTWARPVRDGIDLAFLGDGFLRYQVRRMAGAVLEVAWGDRSTQELRALLSVPRPGAPVRTLPARGLSLERVFYRSGAWTPTISKKRGSKNSDRSSDGTACDRLRGSG